MDGDNIKYHVKFTDEAREILLRAVYPRNVRQFRDVINYSIDSSPPLIEDTSGQSEIINTLTVKDIPFSIIDGDVKAENIGEKKTDKITSSVKRIIDQMILEGKGPRKISHELKEMGYPIEYYKVAYYIRTNKNV